MKERGIVNSGVMVLVTAQNITLIQPMLLLITSMMSPQGDANSTKVEIVWTLGTLSEYLCLINTKKCF